MKCASCGKEIAVDAAFCAYCGKAVEKTAEEPDKDLTRPKSGRMIAGVAAGISRYFGLPVLGIRVGIVVLSVITVGIVALMYLGLIFMIPEDP